MLELLTLNDKNWAASEAKTGPGVSYFETRVNKTSGGSTIGFWVIRTDGSAIDFSFIRADAWASKQM
ncbi:DUF3223 domain-containing protein [Rhizobium johnstonii]|uniref:DUF3223 domain-containing protein n=1 Tax=Rhizobium TaxID=379 RepID=UPI001030D642|nr:DUF3223 domain-containing protein [Rhizobium leguminosarum]